MHKTARNTRTLDATLIANMLYVRARDQYRAALNRAAEVTHASPAVRLRAIGQIDRAAASHRMAMSRLELMGAVHPLDVSDPRD